MKISFLLLLSVMVTSCIKDHPTYFDLYNNSGKPICYYMPWQDGIFYPDTVLPQKNPDPYKFKKEWHFSREGDIFVIIPNDTISIFFFDPDTLAKYDWETVRSEYKILARYDLSQNDLNKLDWRFEYPPTEAMRDMKIYPPYKKD